MRNTGAGQEERWRGRNDKFRSVSYAGNTGKKRMGAAKQRKLTEDVCRVFEVKQCSQESPDRVSWCD